MTWFKLDDQFHSHPKVIVAGNAAVGLYCRLGTYCADKLTDGFVAKAIADSMGTRAELKRLTCCPIPDMRPLLVVVDGGYQMADYLEYNPTREAVLEERRKAKARMDKLRGRSPERTPEHITNEHPNNRANLARSSPSPVPVPLEQVSDNSTSADTAPAGGGSVDIRLNQVADHYARIAVDQAANVDNPAAYKRRARKTALEHPDIGRYLERWPDAPPDAIAAWLHGDKHSMSYFHDTLDDQVATVTHIRGDTA